MLQSHVYLLLRAAGCANQANAARHDSLSERLCAIKTTTEIIAAALTTQMKFSLLNTPAPKVRIAHAPDNSSNLQISGCQR